MSEHKEKWVNEAVKSFFELISEDEINYIDKLFFTDDEIAAIKNKTRIQTTAIDDKRINRIRASRLKLLNYIWKGQNIGWMHFEELDKDDA